MTSLVVLVGMMPLAWAQTHGDGSCRPYGYCDGEKMRQVLTIRGHDVQCDLVPEPRDKCCLPSDKHMVCYNIMVSGQFLNYNQDEPSQTTDFTALCRDLLKVEKKNVGKHTSISVAPGGGTMTYRYENWRGVQAGSNHIRDIACSITE